MDERRNPSKDVGLCIYIYIYIEMSTFETTRVKSPLSLFLSLSLFVRCLINGIQNRITNERSSIMRKRFDERIVGFVLSFALPLSER